MFAAYLSDFFVVVVISNTARMKRRAVLMRDFLAKLKASGVDYVVCELAFGDRGFHLTTGLPNELQIRTIEEFWHKENLINLAIMHGMRLWPHKKNVLWSDADCAPAAISFNDWFEEIWHELQHTKFVQAWEWLQHLDYDGAPLGSHKEGFNSSVNPSFMSNYVKYGTPYPAAKTAGYPNQWGSPGLAWAANVSALMEMGMIGDVGITGGGDWYLAHMLISDLPFPQMSGYTKNYVNYWKNRQELCERWIKRDVGFVKVMMVHYFHGRIKDRGYDWRESILRDGEFDPTTDIKKDANGLWQLETHEPRQIWMRDKLRRYARSRNEDSIDP